MKNKLFLPLVFTVLGLGLSSHALAQSVDLNKVNTVIKGILGPMLAQDDFFSELEFTFDPQSNLAQKQVSFVLKAGSAQTAWTSDVASVELTGDLNSTPVNPNLSRANGNLELSLITDTYEFSQYLKNLSIQMGYCVPQTRSKVDRSFCSQFENALNAKDFDQLKSNFAALNDKIKAQLTAYVDQLTIERASAAATEIPSLDSEIQSLKDDIEALNKVVVTEASDGVTVTVDLLDIFNHQPDSTDKVILVFAMDKNAVSISLDISYTYSAQFDGFVYYFENFLVELEQENVEAKEIVSGTLEGYLQMAKYFLTIK